MEIQVVTLGGKPYIRLRDDLSCGAVFEEMPLDEARSFSRRLHMAIMRASRKREEK